MESLLNLTKTHNRIHNMNDKIKNCLDITKLSDNMLLSICDFDKLLTVCDFSKLTIQEYITLFTIDPTDTDRIIYIFESLFKDRNQISLEEFKTIEFKKFSNRVQQLCLNTMLLCYISTDYICLLLDQIESVNYGSYSDISVNNINPLMYCCRENRLDLVKLLVEKYQANIEYKSCHETTAIMFSAQQGHIYITKYLYEKGAKLETSQRDINSFATDDILLLIKKWNKKKEAQNEEIISLQKKYDQLLSDYNLIKQKYES